MHDPVPLIPTHMKIVVTSQNRKTITPHAGKCRRFWVYEVELMKVQQKALIEVDMEQTLHMHHSGPHPLDGMNVFITASMGAGMVGRLSKQGILPLVTTAQDPDEAVEAFLQHRLPVVQASVHSHHHNAHDDVACNCSH